MKVNVLSGDENSQKLLLQACVPFMDLKDNARFFYREDPSQNPYKLRTGKEDEYYQRKIDENRVRNIKKYIRTAILKDYRKQNVAVIFPTAMLLAFTIDDTSFSIGDIPDLVMPQDFYIVDGQHRLYSMIKLYEDVSGFMKTEEDIIVKEYLEKFRFNCTIMMNFDTWEQAQVFAEVNFNQKRVSRSLYYDIYGMNYSEDSTDKEKNFIYISHNLVKFMNTNPDSPFYQKIKMLGSGQGFVSQACMAEALMRHMSSPQGIWFVDLSKISGKPKYRYMAAELIGFYTVVKKCFSDYWPIYMKHRSILSKTTGVGAMIRLMGYIHVRFLNDDIRQGLKESNGYFYEPYINKVENVLSALKDKAENLFSFKGDFSGTGGRGLELALYNRMCEILNEKLG